MKLPRIIIINKWVVMAILVMVGTTIRAIVFGHLPFTWHLRAFTLNVSVLVIVWETFRLIDDKLNRLLPMQQGYSRRIVAQIASGIVFMVSLQLTLTWLFEGWLPIEVNGQFYLISVMMDVFVSVSINLSYIIKHLMDDLKQAEVTALKLQREQMQMQFNNLKNQLNPHFLFNMLASLDGLITDNPKLASEFLNHLSKVYRYLLQHHDRESVPLSTELDFIRHYLFLLQTRFGTALNIQVALSDETRQRLMLPATLFVLIENVIKHNIVTDTKPLSLRIFAEADWLVVQNTFQPKQNVENSNKQGLVNLASMYQMMSDQPARIISDEQFFTVKIPLL